MSVFESFRHARLASKLLRGTALLLVIASGVTLTLSFNPAPAHAEGGGDGGGDGGGGGGAGGDGGGDGSAGASSSDGASSAGADAGASAGEDGASTGPGDSSATSNANADAPNDGVANANASVSATPAGPDAGTSTAATSPTGTEGSNSTAVHGPSTQSNSTAPQNVPTSPERGEWFPLPENARLNANQNLGAVAPASNGGTPSVSAPPSSSPPSSPPPSPPGSQPPSLPPVDPPASSNRSLYCSISGTVTVGAGPSVSSAAPPRVSAASNRTLSSTRNLTVLAPAPAASIVPCNDPRGAVGVEEAAVRSDPGPAFQPIDAHGICRYIDNHWLPANAAPPASCARITTATPECVTRSFFVPFRTQAEWQAFVAANTQGLTLTHCARPQTVALVRGPNAAGVATDYSVTFPYYRTATVYSVTFAAVNGSVTPHVTATFGISAAAPDSDLGQSWNPAAVRITMSVNGVVTDVPYCDGTIDTARTYCRIAAYSDPSGDASSATRSLKTPAATSRDLR